MSELQTDLNINDESKKRAESEAQFLAFLAECLDEGWCPTECAENCVVEPDGVCPHGFKSVALELGFI